MSAPDDFSFSERNKRAKSTVNAPPPGAEAGPQPPPRDVPPPPRDFYPPPREFLPPPPAEAPKKSGATMTKLNLNCRLIHGGW
ncbi:MAG: hypothetical protein EXS35_03050 [Pedosphaera sp.]|nr:hypothetical protein [Pedosphaera sp.]